VQNWTFRWQIWYRQKKKWICPLASRSKELTVFARPNTGIVGSNPTQGMDVYLRLFCVRVVLCIGNGLERADTPSKKSYRLCIGLRNWKAVKAHKGCRAIDREKAVPTLS
jgi:hypothetical protein